MPANNLNWPEFMARQDPVWDTMPDSYFEGPFVGNGLMGAILFRDDQEPNALRFEIGRTDVYDHRPHGSGLAARVSSEFSGGYANAESPDWFASAIHDRVRLPIGQLLLRPVGTIRAASLRIDLWNAGICGRIQTTAGIIALRCFVPSDSEVIVVTASGQERECGATFHFRPQQGDSPRFLVEPDRDDKSGVKDFSYTPNPPFQARTEGDMEVVTQPLLAGSDYATAWQVLADDLGNKTVFLSVANRKTTTGSAADAVAEVRRAITRGLPALEQAHRDWWHAYYPASFVTLPAPRLESYYWIQLYKMGSAARPDRPVVDLMGPWFKLSVWGAYWHNLNTQLNYAITDGTNHPELGEPLFRWLEERSEDLINNVPVEFRHDSAALGNPTSCYDLVAPAPGPPPDRLGEGAYQFIALPWYMQLFYLHYRHTMDEQRLRTSIFPLLRRAINTYLHCLREEADGRLHVPRAYSDEYGVAEDTNLNLALLRWGLQTLLSVNRRLSLDDPQAARWDEILAQLADYPTDANGLMVGRNTPFAKPHRHWSHLFAIAPLYILNIDDHPGLVPMMERSLEHFLSFSGDDCMFKFTGGAMLHAALGHGDAALALLERALAFQSTGPTLGPNTLYSENNWQTFESPITGARVILDMLLQSWGDRLRIFPACPEAWRDVAFHNLRAEGGFLVSAGRKNGKTDWVQVRSLAGEPCRVLINGKLHELNLAKGEEITLGDGQPVIAPLPMEDSAQNAWGLREP